MKKILSAELYKLYKSKTMRVSLFVASLFAVLTRIFAGNPNMPDYILNSKISLFLIQSVSGNTAVVADGILAGTFIVSEFDKGTAKNAISTGINRAAYYFVKLLCMAIAFFFINLVGAITFTVISMMKENGWNNTGVVYDQYALKLSIYTFVFFSYSLIYASVFVMTAFILQHNAALVVGICSGYMVFEVAFRIFAESSGVKILITIAHSMPAFVTMTLFDDFVLDDLILTTKFISKLILPIIIVIVTTLTGVITFTKKDVK